MVVQVLLATYNGARYLSAQLDSILTQSFKELQIVVRDDGSSDETVDIVEQVRKRDKRIVACYRGEHKGVVGSFFELLARANGKYVAFADQDDVWLPHKLERAVEALESTEPGVPALYCSRLIYVDKALNEIGRSRCPSKPLCIRNALVENIASGCTTVLNQPAAKLLTQFPTPADVQMHDWWSYIVISAFGRVIFDEKPSILYRQHNSNAVGVATNPFHHFFRKVSGHLARKPGLARRQARAFHEQYGNRLKPEAAAIVNDFLNLRSGPAAIPYLFSGHRVYRQQALDDMALLGLMLAGRI